MDENIISSATKSNWVRLEVNDIDIKTRLSKRANKRFSTKNILPLEYFSNSKNLAILNKILDYVKLKPLDIKTVIFNLALNYLKSKNMISFSNLSISTPNRYIQDVLESFGDFKFDDFLLSVEFPTDEKDFLGLVYQSLLKEGSKNKKGSYYTPESVVLREISKLSFSSDMKIFDPCCGTGSFLLSASDKISEPENIYGCDLDEIAVFIAKINLIVKFKDKIFKPNIYLADFLLLKDEIPLSFFDVITTNPPWGAMPTPEYKNLSQNIKSGESFSYFIENSCKYLKNNGQATFVLPVSILNVASHKDVRKFILDNFQINEIHLYGKIFSGVLSDVISIQLKKSKRIKNIRLTSSDFEKSIPQLVYQNNPRFDFTLFGEDDLNLLDKIYSIPHNTLADSVWALGIVTGNNKKHLSKKLKSGLEQIYSGKNITSYFIKQSNKFIRYDRNKFQQVASDKIYRAKEKLVYKFISKKLFFAYDNEGKLFLNSANILIPKVKAHSIKTILAFLNSKLMQYVYCTKFNELKVLKSNLSLLPFPELTTKDKKDIEQLVESYMVLNDENILNKIDKKVYSLFKLSKEEICYIEKTLANS